MQLTKQMQRKDQIRHGKFNLVTPKSKQTLQKQMLSVLPDYYHNHVLEAFRFGDEEMIRELTHTMMQAAEVYA